MCGGGGGACEGQVSEQNSGSLHIVPALLPRAEGLWECQTLGRTQAPLGWGGQCTKETFYCGLQNLCHDPTQLHFHQSKALYGERVREGCGETGRDLEVAGERRKE